MLSHDRMMGSCDTMLRSIMVGTAGRKRAAEALRSTYPIRVHVYKAGTAGRQTRPKGLAAVSAPRELRDLGADKSIDIVTARLGDSQHSRRSIGQASSAVRSEPSHGI